MAEQKDELGQATSKPHQSKKTAAGGSTAESPSAATASAGADDTSRATTVTQRKRQYLIEFGGYPDWPRYPPTAFWKGSR